VCNIKVKGKGKAIPLQAWTGPEGFRRLRLPHFKTIGTRSWEGCQPYAPAAFTPQDISLVLISVTGISNRIIRVHNLSPPSNVCFSAKFLLFIAKNYKVTDLEQDSVSQFCNKFS
jgi:hypothetical protein